MVVGDTYHACQYGDQRSVIIVALFEIAGVPNVAYKVLYRGTPNQGPAQVDVVTSFIEEYYTTYATARRKYLKDQIRRQESAIKSNRTTLEKIRNELSKVRDE